MVHVLHNRGGVTARNDETCRGIDRAVSNAMKKTTKKSAAKGLLLSTTTVRSLSLSDRDLRVVAGGLADADLAGTCARSCVCSH